MLPAIAGDARRAGFPDVSWCVSAQRCRTGLSRAWVAGLAACQHAAQAVLHPVDVSDPSKGIQSCPSLSQRYIVPTERWYLERRTYLAVGVKMSLAFGLSLLHSPAWLWFTRFVGAAMVWFAGTGVCMMANGLFWLGAEPQLVPTAEATSSGSRAGKPASA